jgi:hypothetical protein
MSLKEKRRGEAGCGVENGEISLWDTVDGQCLESKRMAQVHTIMQAYRYLVHPHTLSRAVSLSACGIQALVDRFDSLLRDTGSVFTYRGRA